MDNQKPKRPEPLTDAVINLRSGAAIIVAAAFGAVAGTIAASKLPSDKFAWTGFALVPLFLLLEVLLKHFVAYQQLMTNAKRKLAGCLESRLEPETSEQHSASKQLMATNELIQGREQRTAPGASA